MRDWASAEIAWTTREPSSTGERPPFCAACGSPPLDDAPLALCVVLCVLCAAILSQEAFPGSESLRPCAYPGPRFRWPVRARELVRLARGEVAQELAHARLAQLAADRLDRLLDHAVAVPVRHQVGAHDCVVL